jgi:hypothetical protein
VYQSACVMRHPPVVTVDSVLLRSRCFCGGPRARVADTVRSRRLQSLHTDKGKRRGETGAMYVRSPCSVRTESGEGGEGWMTGPAGPGHDPKTAA